MKTLLAMAFALTAGASFAQVTTYKVDPAATNIEWHGTKITGEHKGQVKVKEGTLAVQGETLTGGEIVVDMKSMTSTDITDKETNAKFIGHMTSADFFEVEKYPEAKLVIKSSKKTNKGLEVKGDLTMHGKTNPVTFTATDIKQTADTYKAKTKLVLDRTKWDLKYASKKFFKSIGDKAIHDEFTLTIDLTAKK